MSQARATGTRVALLFRCVWRLTIALTLLTISEPGTARVSTPEPSSAFEVRTETTIDFPGGIGFSVDLSAMSPDEGSPVELHYTIAGNETDHLVFVPSAARSGAAGLVIDLPVDLQSVFVPSGVTLEYHWEVALTAGELATTKPEAVTWLDTRWNWETVRSAQVVLHSYDLSPDFARTILESAQSTVTDLEDRYSLERSEPIVLWIYPSIEDYRGAQQPNSRESIAGASYPGLFLVAAVLSNGDTREVGRVIPHEISHQVLYQATRNPFTLPPLWFDEGLATHYQIGGTDGYLQMVTAAHREDRLFDLDSLDTTFPFLPSQATLAYATSWSAIEYIQERYGDEGIERLIAAFATGDSFDSAMENALGMSIIEMNDTWRAWIEFHAKLSIHPVAATTRHLPLAA